MADTESTEAPKIPLFALQTLEPKQLVLVWVQKQSKEFKQGQNLPAALTEWCCSPAALTSPQ